MKPNKITLELDTDTPHNYKFIELLKRCHAQGETVNLSEFDNAAYAVKELKVNGAGVYTVKLVALRK